MKDKWCKSLSTTFITLIPKKKEAVDLKNFRSISLVGCIYKLLAKTLAIRLKEALVNVISDSQHAFLPRRQMIDCLLMANENIDAMLKVDWAKVVCKVDMEKAYDHVNWGYIDWVLDKMGFGLKWRNWMKIYITPPSFSVMVIGSPKGFFKASKGGVFSRVTRYLFIFLL